MDAALFWFILMFTMPSFGGDVEVKITTRTTDGCERLQKVITRELYSRKMSKYVLMECPDGRVPVIAPTILEQEIKTTPEGA